MIKLYRSQQERHVPKPGHNFCNFFFDINPSRVGIILAQFRSYQHSNALVVHLRARQRFFSLKVRVVLEVGGTTLWKGMSNGKDMRSLRKPHRFGGKHSLNASIDHFLLFHKVYSSIYVLGFGMDNLDFFQSKVPLFHSYTDWSSNVHLIPSGRNAPLFNHPAYDKNRDSSNSTSIRFGKHSRWKEKWIWRNKRENSKIRNGAELKHSLLCPKTKAFCATFLFTSHLMESEVFPPPHWDNSAGCSRFKKTTLEVANIGNYFHIPYDPPGAVSGNCLKGAE